MAGKRMRAYLIGQAERAAEQGHTLRVEHRPGPNNRELFWGVCSCGYSSTRRNTQAYALSAALAHAAEVVAEAEVEASRNGVSLPGSVRPAL